MGKTVVKDFRNKKRRDAREDELMVFPNTHEPIITGEMWERAQRKKKKNHKRLPSGSHTHRLSGYVYCADCGSKMGISVQATKNAGLSCYFQCSQYRRNSMYGECESHNVSADAIENLILEAVKRISVNVLENKEQFIEEVMGQCKEKQTISENDDKKELASSQRRLEELNLMLRKIYEDNVTGKLSDRQFKALSVQYDAEMEGLEHRMEELETLLLADKPQKTDPKRFAALIKKYTDFTEITDEMLFELVDRVEVHKATGGRGRYRQQKIDIHFNFLGDYEPFGKEIPEEERTAMIDKEYAEKRERYKRTSYENRQAKIAQLKIDAENGDEDAVRELERLREIGRRASAKQNVKYREARNADAEYIALKDAKEQERILKLQEKERKRTERTSKKAKEKRSELVERAKTDPEAMEELSALRAKEAAARAKKKEREQQRMEKDPEYAKMIEERKKAYNRRHTEQRKTKLQELKDRAEYGEEEAVEELARYRKYQCDAATKSRNKMMDAAEAGDLDAVVRKERYLQQRRDYYRTRKTEDVSYAAVT